MSCLGINHAGEVAILGGLGVFAPPFALVGVVVLGVKALVHACFLNYHWRHSMDESGKPWFDESEEKRKNATDLTSVDKQRSEHEAKRFEAQESMFGTLLMIRACAKALVPIFGLIWIVSTELERDGAFPIAASDAPELHTRPYRPNFHSSDQNLLYADSDQAQ